MAGLLYSSSNFEHVSLVNKSKRTRIKHPRKRARLLLQPKERKVEKNITHINNPPFQIVFQKRHDVLGREVPQLPDLDVVHEHGRDDLCARNFDVLVVLRAAMVARLAARREDVVDARHGGLVCVIPHVLIVEAPDEVEDCEGAVQGEAAVGELDQM